MLQSENFKTAISNHYYSIEARVGKSLLLRPTILKIDTKTQQKYDERQYGFIAQDGTET